MSEHQDASRFSWLRSMDPRNPNETHRQASFLELFFDLCFVVAIAQAAAQLHHALAEDHIASGIIGFLMVFFAIWWAWMNFTWFASAYDNDDVPFRIATFIQITGALILAAGVPRAFTAQNFNIIFIGYAVMRSGLVALWIRAALHDPDRKSTNFRYAIGISGAMVGWGIMFITNYWPIWAFALMAFIELGIPTWAEKAHTTPWHPGHIAERYGLFTIIVLGESVLAATNAVQVALDQQGGSFSEMLSVIAGGLLILFSMWWLYFSKSAHHFLTSRKTAFFWGYGHYLIFASIAAVGAGIGVNIDFLTDHAALGVTGVAATITIPTALYLFLLWVIHIRPHHLGTSYLLLYLLGALAVLTATFTSLPILLSGFITSIMVAIRVMLSHKKNQQATKPG